MNGSLSGCANISSPTGGPRDTTAPRVIQTLPANYSTNFTANGIELTFDEYITLKDPSREVFISPPLKGKLTTTLRGKKLRVSWKDTLIEETTYTINFGKALTDLTEGNVQEKFRYVFSTGDALDSLELGGTVTNAYTGKTEEGWRALLYPWTGAWDSVPLLQRPLYYSLTDANGNFNLENLKPGSYGLLVLNDLNGDFRYNPGAEAFAFLAEPIEVGTETASLKLRSSREKRSTRFLSSRAEKDGLVRLTFFSRPKDLEIEVLYPTDEKPVWFNRQDGDTLTLYHGWITPDSLVLRLLSSSVSDTAVVHNFREYEPAAPKVESSSARLRPQDSLVVTWNRALASVDPEKIFWSSGTDTLSISGKVRTDGLRLLADVSGTNGKQGILILYPGAVLTLDGAVNEDTIIKRVQFLGEEDLAVLQLKVSTDSSSANLPLVLRITGPDYLLEHDLSHGRALNLTNLIPGKYKLELIEDRNGNGKWDPGSFLQGIQPEYLIPYHEPVELRANWELEVNWKLPGLSNQIDPGR